MSQEIILYCANYQHCENEDAIHIRQLSLCSCLFINITDPLAIHFSCGRCLKRDSIIFSVIETFCELCFVQLCVNTNIFNLRSSNDYYHTEFQDDCKCFTERENAERYG
jgi:hypothetical protein